MRPSVTAATTASARDATPSFFRMAETLKTRENGVAQCLRNTV
jgi:hypothetical protein